jgi:hypothetical protein
MELGDDQLTIALFQDMPIRRTWHEDRWFYSVIDCMAPLSGSPNPRRYWSDMKRRMLAEEQVNVDTLGVIKLPLPAQDGSIKKTDCADKETLFRLIQSVKSPNAEPFKQWLAHMGADISDALEQPDEHQARADTLYKLELTARALRQLVSFRGIVTERQHQAFVDSNYAGLYDVLTQRALMDMRGYWPTMDMRQWMGLEELTDNLFQRVQTRALIQRNNIRGAQHLNTAAYDVGVEVRLTLQRLGATMPEDLPRHKPLSKYDYLPELRDPPADMLPPPTDEEDDDEVIDA